ncbi:MAG: uroporphyrinogen-III synthase [Vicinamibacteria bacterium]|nr:uroporphyrinogen-III synthase [Vicinamibacteria bacterium]
MPTENARPLTGRRIIVTRRPAQAVELAKRLGALGARIVELPAIEIEPPEDFGPLDSALGDLDSYDWLVFTSANAVRFVSERFDALGLDPIPGNRCVRVAVIGPATADQYAVSFGGSRPDLLPDADYRAEGLVAAFEEFECSGLRFLLPLGDRARGLLERALSTRGAQVDVVTAYRTVAPPDLSERLSAELRDGVDLVTFASSSAVENLAAAAGHRVLSIPAAVIGPSTEASASAAGFNVCAVAASSTIDGLIEAVLEYFAGEDLRE